MFTGNGLDGLFAGQLALAINAQRRGPVMLLVRRWLVSIKDVVGGVMDQRNLKARCFFGQYTRACGIDREGLLSVALGRIDCSVGRRIDDQVGTQQAHLLAYLLGLGQIQGLLPEGKQLSFTGERQLQLLRQLPLVAGDQNFHGKSSTSLRRLPAMSLADSCGDSSIGHSMPSSGSFQSRLRSCSGA